MRRILLLMLLLLPLANASIMVYTKGLDYAKHYDDGTYVELTSVEDMIAAWKAWGYDVVETDIIDTGADALIVFSCADISEKEVEEIRRFIDSGGRVVLDLQCRSLLDNIAFDYGFLRSGKTYTGIRAVPVETEYARIRGYVIESSIKRSGTPVDNDYVEMVYAGPSFTITGDRLLPFFAPHVGNEVVAAMDKDGRVILTGCLVCGNQYLVANILDYAEDGKVDFPPVDIKRRTYPEKKLAGRPFYDEVTVVFPEDESLTMTATVSYMYNEPEVDPKMCKLVPKMLPEEPTENGIKFVAKYFPEEKMECMLGPVSVEIVWVSPEGKKIRYVEKEGEYVVVGLPPLYVPHMNSWAVLASILAIIVSLAVIFFSLRQRWETKRIRERLDEIEFAMQDLERKLMTRQISEDVYKNLVKELIAEAEALKAKLRKYEGQRRKAK